MSNSETPRITIIMSNLEVSMLRANCYAYTFDDPKIMKLVRSLVEGNILNLFAGKNIVSAGEIRIDLDSSMPKLTHCMDAADYLNFAKLGNNKFETIIYDPPWNERKAKEFYNGNYIGKFTKLKNDIVSLLSYNGIIISVGYEIDNFSEKRGMRLEQIFVINPSGEIRPFFITVERKLPSLEEYEVN